MKFAMRDARMVELLAADGDHSWAIAAFFFHDRETNETEIAHWYVTGASSVNATENPEASVFYDHTISASGPFAEI